jgi:hypothetical protein
MVAPVSNGPVFSTQGIRSPGLTDPLPPAGTTNVAATPASFQPALADLLKSVLYTGLTSIPQDQRNTMADAVQTGAPIVGGASMAALTFMCMQCMVATTGAAFIGKDLGGFVGNQVADVMRQPDSLVPAGAPATPVPAAAPAAPLPAPASDPMATMPGMPGMGH